MVHQYCVNEYLRKIKMQIKVHVYKVETDQCIYIIDRAANLKYVLFPQIIETSNYWDKTVYPDVLLMSKKILLLI